MFMRAVYPPWWRYSHQVVAEVYENINAVPVQYPVLTTGSAALSKAILSIATSKVMADQQPWPRRKMLALRQCFCLEQATRNPRFVPAYATALSKS